MDTLTSVSRTAVATVMISGFLLGQVSTAEARRGNALGIGLGIAAGAVILNELGKGGASASPERPRYKSSTPKKKSKSDDDDNDGEEREASKKVPPVPPSRQLTAQESYELQEKARTEREDRQRNVDRHVSDFIAVLRIRHVLRSFDQKLNETSIKASSEVTEADVRRTLDDAYDLEHLGQFAKFEGEPWSKERLQVRILTQAMDEVGPYFDGVGSRGPNAGDVAQIMQKSARKVFTQVFELSEMLGMVASHERLYRDISEGGTSDKTDQYIEVLAGPAFDRAVADVLAASLKARPDGSVYAYKLRARRAVYDCVATVATALAAQSQGTEPAAAKPEQRAESPAATVHRASTEVPSVKEAPSVKIVEEAADKTDAADRVLQGDLKGFLIKSCGERIAKLGETTLMPIPAKAVLDGQTRPVVDGQVWLISAEPASRR